MKPSKRGNAARFIGSSPSHVDVWATHGRGSPCVDQALLPAAASWKAQVPAWQQVLPAHEEDGSPRAGDQTVAPFHARELPVSAAFWLPRSLLVCEPGPPGKQLRQPSLFP